jgi:hypothetical protein
VDAAEAESVLDHVGGVVGVEGGADLVDAGGGREEEKGASFQLVVSGVGDDGFAHDVVEVAVGQDVAFQIEQEFGGHVWSHGSGPGDEPAVVAAFGRVESGGAGRDEFDEEAGGFGRGATEVGSVEVEGGSVPEAVADELEGFGWGEVDFQFQGEEGAVVVVAGGDAEGVGVGWDGIGESDPEGVGHGVGSGRARGLYVRWERGMRGGKKEAEKSMGRMKRAARMRL